MQINELQHKKVVIVGLGSTGLSCLKFVTENGISPVVMDTRTAPANIESLKQQYAQLEFVLGGLSEEHLLSADIVLLSPGMPKETPEIAKAIAAGVEVFCDVELFARLNDKPLVAITGSNGKSTATMLTAEMLNASGIKTAVGGNIGVPVLELLESDAQAFVLELSSFQLETLSSLQPAAATILNVSEDHLDRYQGSIELYAQAKQRVYHNAKVCIVNRQDSRTAVVEAKGAVKQFNGEDANTVDDSLCLNGEKLIPVSDVKLIGQHNMENAQASALLAKELGATNQGICQALRTYAGLAHRTEWVADKLGARWINDSKATNVGSTLAALEGLAGSGELILIAGGEGKGADFSPLKNAMESGVKQLITLGKDGEKIAALKRGSVQVADLNTAVKTAARLVAQGDIVLLSPACASLDMFKNFEQRGDEFRRAVEAL